MNAASHPVIETVGLTKVFKDFWNRPKVKALNNVDMMVPEGNIVALLGPNGSGKTTLIKILLGLLFPSSGMVKVLGENAFDVKVKTRIGFLPEKTYFYEHLSGRETLDFYAKLLGLPSKSRKSRIEELLQLTKMEHQAHRPLGEYSLGMSRRIGIAQALLADPELLILDEPTGGLDPLGVEEIHQLIGQLKEKGKTILISTHLLSECEEICDLLTILYQGEVLCQGQVKELKEQYQSESMKQLFLKVLDEKRQTAVESVSENQKEDRQDEGPDTDFLNKITGSK